MKKVCTKCNIGKTLESFKLTKSAANGRSSWCKKCHSADSVRWQRENRDKRNSYKSRWKKTEKGKLHNKVHRKKYKAVSKKAQPLWANLKTMRAIYSMASKLNVDVDHIVPLRGKLVCGLHCEGNLQLLSRKENQKKTNKFDSNSQLSPFYRNIVGVTM